MHAKRSPSPPGEHIEIAARLRSLDNTEARFPAGDLQIPWVVGGDLKKNAAVGTALVGLSSRMQETWAELGAGGDFLPVANGEAHPLQITDVFVIARDVSQKGDIVAGLCAREMRLEPRG